MFKNEAAGPLVTYMKKLEDLVDEQNKHFDTNAKTAEDAADVLRTLLVVVTLGACVVAFATGFWICAASPCRWVVNRMWPAK